MRVRLGIVYPGGGAEQEYYQFADRLPGLSIYLVFSRRAGAGGHSHSPVALRKTARVANLVEAAQRLAMLRTDAVMWACTSGSFIVGRVGAERQVRAIRRIVGAPTGSTSLAFVSALRHMRLRRVAIAATYPPSAAGAFARFLRQFRIEAQVVEVADGPTVTRYEIRLGDGIRVKKIVDLADNIMLSLSAYSVRVEAPIPGKAAIYVDNMLKATVDGLQKLRRPEDVARIRGLTVAQVLPVPAKKAEETETESNGEAEDHPDA